MIGRRLGGRYDIISRIGTGGMAAVYRARCSFLHRDVAVKILKQDLAQNQEFLDRFRREARAAASLSHPNVVAIYDVGEDEGLPYIVMEYIEGPTLKELVTKDGPLPVGRALDIMQQVLAALEHAHSHRVIHRDIKPHNILLTKAGMVKVADFGIARAASGSTLEYTETILGTAHYFSPEQARGGFVGERADIYASGVVLYEMLTGRVPFEGDSPVTIALKHINDPVPPASQYNPDLTPAVEAAIMKALHKDRDRRYGSACEMSSTLEQAAAGKMPDPDPGESESPTVEMPPVRATKRIQGCRADKSRRGDEPKNGAREKPMFQRWALVFWVLILVAVGLSVTYAGYRAWDWWDVPVVQVPYVEGRNLEDAQRLLEATDLTGRISGQRHHDSIPVGYIIQQDPGAGEDVRKSRVVELIMSLGPEWIDQGVPGVVDMHAQAAEATLFNAGLHPEVVERYDDDVPASHVIEQNPASGTRVQKGTTVVLTVSLGPEPSPFNLPGFIGQPAEDARARLTDLGMRLRVVEEYTEYPDGIVADQNPRPGVEVRPGDLVVLVVSKGGEDANSQVVTITVPDTPAEQEMLVRVIDVRGERTVYRNTHSAGDVITMNVYWYDDTARIRVFADGHEIEDWVLEVGD